ncbi:MAG TPA: helix-turn-helix domain-containing protein [Verrucomicrobiae bacterium]
MTAPLNAKTTTGGQNPAAEIFTDETCACYIGGIEPRTVRSFRMTRGLPFVKLSSKVVRIRKVDVDKWLARHAVSITRGTA